MKTCSEGRPPWREGLDRRSPGGSPRTAFGKKPSDLKNVENLLGKVVLLAGSYGRGNLFIILLGEIPKNQGSAFGELRAWMESVGGRTIQR